MPETRLRRLREVNKIEDRFRYVVGDINQLHEYTRGLVSEGESARTSAKKTKSSISPKPEIEEVIAKKEGRYFCR